MQESRKSKSKKHILSMVIPVWNEEQLIKHEVAEIVTQAERTMAEIAYEILLVENGSRDRTKKIGKSLAQTYSKVRIISLPNPLYGKAVKIGLLEGKGSYLVLFNIDFWDIGFTKRALDLCKTHGYDIVVGSKTMKGARDLRPFTRRLITRVFNFVLRVMFGFRGTDTHGMKVFRKTSILPIVHQCQTNTEIFETELLLRAQRSGLKIKEIPVVCQEKRRSTVSIVGRILRNLKALVWLFFSLRSCSR